MLTHYTRIRSLGVSHYSRWGFHIISAYSFFAASLRQSTVVSTTDIRSALYSLRISFKLTPSAGLLALTLLLGVVFDFNKNTEHDYKHTVHNTLFIKSIRSNCPMQHS
jgi:hypothetical protein